MFNDISTQVSYKIFFFQLILNIYKNDFILFIYLKNVNIDDKANPIHLAFYLRFFFIFRNYIPK